MMFVYTLTRGTVKQVYRSNSKLWSMFSSYWTAAVGLFRKGGYLLI